MNRRYKNQLSLESKEGYQKDIWTKTQDNFNKGLFYFFLLLFIILMFKIM